MRILILLLLFSTQALANSKNSVGYITIDVHDPNSLNYDKVNHSTFGSGIILNYEEKSYFATNAHVCYGSQYTKISLENKKVNYEFNFAIKTLKQNYLLTLYPDQIKVNIQEDVCLLELPTYYKEGYTITFNKISLYDHKKAYFLTFNRLKKDKIVKFSGKLQKVNQNKLIDINVVSESQQHIETFFTMKEQSLYSFLAIPGDSGSPVFNFNNELIGLVFSSEKSNKQASIVNITAIMDLLKSFKQ